MKQLLLKFIFMLYCLSAHGQHTVTVEAEFIYYVPDNESLSEARRTAVEKAKLKALATEFGTTVSGVNIMRIDQTDTDFLSINSTEVKGEWIEDLGEPVFQKDFEGEQLVLKVKVRGLARKVVAATIDFKAQVLCNGTNDKKHASTHFRHGGDLYLSFQSPVSGYLAVYLIDAEQNVFCLLPYEGQTEGIYTVEANRRYVFFNRAEAPDRDLPYVQDYHLACAANHENNQIYVIFSPNRFSKAVDDKSLDDQPRSLSYPDFNQWLVNNRRVDAAMNVRLFLVEISK
ncbi:MAG: DUF4384 domain-containing protein [Prevotella sp.]|nr:DUF4384 domain-containing protein [Prevotella sp.]